MRSLLSKITALAVVLFMMLGFLAIPAASAQSYPPVAPQPVICSDLPAPAIAIVGTDIVVTFPNGTLTCVIRVVLDVNPTLYDGPPPVTGTLVRPVPALTGDSHTATVTAFYSTGDTPKSASVTISASALAGARAAFIAAGGTLPPSDGDVAAAAAAASATAAAAAAPAQNLAFTGADVNLPLAAGALLVGSGGLVLLAARKRERNA